MKQTVDWHKYWEENRIAFHEGQVNPYLKRFLPIYNLQPGDTVFMPLCGKAVDIFWLTQQGFNVIGVELSEIAVRSFFEESELEFSHQQYNRFNLFRSDKISLFQGNYMHLESSDIAACKLVYDRASIIAIESFNRSSYVQKMLEIIPARTPMLMVTLDYDQQVMSGPPYAVSSEEIRQLFAPDYETILLHSSEQIEERPRWRENGLSSLIESALSLSALK
jgi:thiopurine S-methyltransferase